MLYNFVLYYSKKKCLLFYIPISIKIAFSWNKFLFHFSFLCIMPTLMRVYSNNQPNPVLKNAIHFVCKQFYILHRKPFMLQMFGSVAPLLDMNCASGGVRDCTKVKPGKITHA